MKRIANFFHFSHRQIDEALQWVGAVCIIVGHSLNALGPAFYPYNIFVFFIGTLMFFIWASRVSNKPQMAVNFASLGIGLTGIINALLTQG
jgi:hypothetical protein